MDDSQIILERTDVENLTWDRCHKLLRQAGTSTWQLPEKMQKELQGKFGKPITLEQILSYLKTQDESGHVGGAKATGEWDLPKRDVWNSSSSFNVEVITSKEEYEEVLEKLFEPHQRRFQEMQIMREYPTERSVERKGVGGKPRFGLVAARNFGKYESWIGRSPEYSICAFHSELAMGIRNKIWFRETTGFSGDPTIRMLHFMSEMKIKELKLIEFRRVDGHKFSVWDDIDEFSPKLLQAPPATASTYTWTYNEQRVASKNLSIIMSALYGEQVGVAFHAMTEAIDEICSEGSVLGPGDYEKMVWKMVQLYQLEVCLATANVLEAIRAQGCELVAMNKTVRSAFEKVAVLLGETQRPVESRVFCSTRVKEVLEQIALEQNEKNGTLPNGRTISATSHPEGLLGNVEAPKENCKDGPESRAEKKKEYKFEHRVPKKHVGFLMEVLNGRCRQFVTRHGCQRGDNCKFIHQGLTAEEAKMSVMALDALDLGGLQDGHEIAKKDRVKMARLLEQNLDAETQAYMLKPRSAPASKSDDEGIVTYGGTRQGPWAQTAVSKVVVGIEQEGSTDDAALQERAFSSFGYLGIDFRD